MGWRERNERLLEAGLALSSELELPAILQRIVDLAVELTGHHRADRPAPLTAGGAHLPPGPARTQLPALVATMGR
jgi:hypothetical protein